MTKQLRVDGITKSYGSEPALRGVSLEIGNDELVAVLGPSGSGKTTLLGVVAGLIEQDGGKVEIDGKQVDGLTADKRDVGLVFQEGLLFPHKTVKDNILFPLRVRGVERSIQVSRFEWVAGLVRLKEKFWNRYPHQLSGGQAQRVALARGLVGRPKVLLLDEPLANLDRELRERLEAEIRQLHGTFQMPFLYVTHNQEEALAIGNRIVVLREGRVEQDGEARNIYEHPTSAFVAGFVGKSNSFLAPVHRVKDGQLEVKWEGDLLRVPAPKGVVRTGYRVRCFIREEDIWLSPASGEDGRLEKKGLSGTVIDQIFLGGSVRYIVELMSGERVAVLRGNQEEVANGCSVSIGWPTEKARTFLACGDPEREDIGI